MAKIIDKLVNNDIIILANAGEAIIARFVSENADGSITVFKAHTIAVRPTPQGASIGFADYSAGQFLVKRDMRDFDPANFVAIDKAEGELAGHFNTFLSGVKPVKKPALIGLGPK